MGANGSVVEVAYVGFSDSREGSPEAVRLSKVLCPVTKSGGMIYQIGYDASEERDSGLGCTVWVESRTESGPEGNAPARSISQRPTL